MDNEKAIRAAKLTLGGILEKRRAKTAVERAQGQIAPSKYLPDVPRQVHADGGEVANLRREKLLRALKKAAADVNSGAHQEMMDQRAYKLHESGHLPLTVGTKVTPPQGWEMPGNWRIHGYWQDIIRPDQYGYKLKSDSGEMYDVHHVRQNENPNLFGGGFRAYSGPTLDRPKYPEAKPTEPSIKDPEREAKVKAEYDDLFGSDPNKYANGGYVPTASLPIPKLAVASPLATGQQPGFLDVLGTLNKVAGSARSISDLVRPEKEKTPHAERVEAKAEGLTPEASAAMEALRKGWTGQDFGIVSGYRSPEENRAAKGAKDSQHIHGNAYDVNTTGWSPEDKLALADAAWNAGFRGFGFYDNNMHFDVAGPRAWGPSYSRDSIPDWAQGWAQERYGYNRGGPVMTEEQIIDQTPVFEDGAERLQGALDDVSRAGTIGSRLGKLTGIPIVGSLIGRNLAEQAAMSSTPRVVPSPATTTSRAGLATVSRTPMVSRTSSTLAPARTRTSLRLTSVGTAHGSPATPQWHRRMPIRTTAKGTSATAGTWSRPTPRPA